MDASVRLDGVTQAHARSPRLAQPTSQVQTWEPSNAAIAARYGLRPEEILRFDLNTSPVAPAFLPDVLRGPFDRR